MKSNKQHKVTMKVVNMKYWETRRGVGYEAAVEGSNGEKYGFILNHGDGGATIFDVHAFIGKTRKDFSDYSEWDLENLINDFEIKNPVWRK